MMSNTRGDCALTDDIVGIETTDGKVCYFHRTTLVNVGGYFAARFGNGGRIPPGSERRDEIGRSIYFVERDGELFGKYIRPYILTNKLGDLPSFDEAPRVWRALRDEASFYAMDGLSELLETTHVCNPNDPLGRGVLYYLGTNKGREEYQNPHARGAVAIGGWFENQDEYSEELGEIFEWSRHEVDHKASTKSLQALVQYKPPVKGEEESPFFVRELFSPRVSCDILGCGFSAHRMPVVLDLTSISLCPTAYSLRYGGCDGASYWNFEASEDGVQWTVLHEARYDTHISYYDYPLVHYDPAKYLDWTTDDLLSYTERNLRHTWKIELSSPKFFRFFRIIGIGSDWPEDADVACLHAVGLELFGDIHEE